MRRQEREVTGKAALEDILKACKVCRLAMVEGGVPYIVPMNFGYSWHGDCLKLYFHSAAQGRKIDCLRRAEPVAFELDCGHELVEGHAPCECTYRFTSLMGVGKPAFCETAAEKTQALNFIMLHQTGRGEHTYPPAALERTAVFQITVTQLTGKQYR